MTPYDSNSQFYISSLARLEAAGIKVVSALRDNFDCLKKTLGLTASKDVAETVEHVMELWEGKKDSVPMTWRKLLQIVSQVMDLKELSQQIENYLLEGMQCVQ